MDLSISHILFRNFRSYEWFELNDIGSLTIFVGPNAIGKTNIIEGIQLLTAQTSFRNPSPSELIRFNEQLGHIECDVSDTNRHLQFVLNIKEGKKQFSLNGKVKKTADIKGIIPSVSFTPDDLELAKGSMSKRRGALDTLGSQLSKNHYLIRRDYEKVLRYKNKLLKDEASFDLIASINEMVVTCGAQLVAYRSALFEKLRQYMKMYYQNITNSREEFYACYIPSWESYDENMIENYSFTRDDARSALSDALTIRFNEEQIRHRALVGPHADKIEFFISGKNVSTFASQGQQRSVVLAFKLAEAALIQEILHQKPVLLLDDVMSELDDTRRRSLINYIAGDIQTFITTTHLDYFDSDLLKRARIVQLPLISRDNSNEVRR